MAKCNFTDAQRSKNAGMAIVLISLTKEYSLYTVKKISSAKSGSIKF
uniref:Uncharacterized protein n=1 Tax=Meloidogyne enterolobii TaxID=390850 RepID=A0A6V7UJ83_MELEN|nr:unnamed protein product [Meloidogyne enterolobii]